MLDVPKQLEGCIDTGGKSVHFIHPFLIVRCWNLRPIFGGPFSLQKKGSNLPSWPGGDLEAVLNTTPSPIPRRLVLQRHAGLYLDKSLQPEFKETG